MRAGALVLATACFAMPQALALAPGAEIVNRAAVSFEVRGAIHVTEDTDTLIAASDAGNSPPHGLRLEGGAIPENEQGARVGVLQALDIDPEDQFTFTTADPRFIIAGDVLSLAPGQSFDFELTSSTTVLITVTDTAGGSRVHQLLIQVQDVNEQPFDLRVEATAIDADQPGVLIGPLRAVDPDNGDTLRYAVDDSRFVIREGHLYLGDSAQIADGETVVLNLTATDRGGLSTTSTVTLRSTRISKPRPTPSSLDFLLPVDAGTVQEVISRSSCESGVSAGQPRTRAGTLLSMPASLSTLPAPIYATGETLFLRLVDTDQNLDSRSIESIEVTVSSVIAGTVDIERVLLVETRADSGTFTGFLLSANVAVGGDCRIGATPGAVVRMNYADPDDGTDVTEATAPIAGVLHVWASDTGTPINGVEVRLVDSATGQLADSAISGLSESVYPAALRTGEIVRDASDAVWQPPAGGVLLPVVAQGQYRVEVVPVSGYRFPTTQPDAALERVAAGRYRTSIGSKGEAFVIAASSGLNFDMPVDPIISDVFLTKEASTDVIEVGDRLQYRLRLQTDGSRPLNGATLTDRLPEGF